MDSATLSLTFIESILDINKKSKHESIDPNIKHIISKQEILNNKIQNHLSVLTVKQSELFKSIDEKMSKQLLLFGENLSEKNIQELKKMVEDYDSYIESKLKDNLTILNLSISELNKWQINNLSTMKDYQSSLTDISSFLQDSKATHQFLENLANNKNFLSDINDSLNINLNYINTANNNIENILNKSAESQKNINKQSTIMYEKSLDSFKNINNSFSSLSDNIISNTSEIKKMFKESHQPLTNLIDSIDKIRTTPFAIDIKTMTDNTDNINKVLKSLNDTNKLNSKILLQDINNIKEN